MGFSNGVAYGCRLSALQMGHPQNSSKAVSQGMEGSGMADMGETLGSPCLPLVIRALYISQSYLETYFSLADFPFACFSLASFFVSQHIVFGSL